MKDTMNLLNQSCKYFRLASSCALFQTLTGQFTLNECTSSPHLLIRDVMLGLQPEISWVRMTERLHIIYV
jgi:hypothetical protein